MSWTLAKKRTRQHRQEDVDVELKRKLPKAVVGKVAEADDDDLLLKLPLDLLLHVLEFLISAMDRIQLRKMNRTWQTLINSQSGQSAYAAGKLDFSLLARRHEARNFIRNLESLASRRNSTRC